jgi:hypothetical protein
MLGLRRTILALLGAVVTLLAAILVPAAAVAQGTAITIASAGPDSTGNPYDLTVYAADANGVAITSMVAHVYDSGSNDVANVTMNPVSTTDTANQQWAAAAPIAQGSLPAGTYTVTVDAGDGTTTDSNDTGLVPAQQLETFSYTTTVSVTPSQTTVTEGSDNVSFSGTVTGQAPGGTAVPLTNVPVNLSIGGGSTNFLENTDSSGNFSYSATGILASTDYNFSVAATSTYTANNNDIPITTVASSTTMTAGAVPANITEGSTNVTFSGNVQANGTNIVGATVSMSINGGAPTPLPNPTDSNGNYSYTVDNAQPTSYSFSITGTPLYSAASAGTTVGTAAAATTMNMNAPSPATVSYGAQTVTFSGTVTTTAGASPVSGAIVTVTPPGGSPIQLPNPTDSSGNFSWTDTTAQPGQYAFSIPDDPGGLYSGSSASSTVGVTLAPTTVSLPTTPLTVTEGAQNVMINGTVTALPAGITIPVPVSNAPVYLDGGSTPVATTNSSGQFSYPATNVSATTTYTFSVNAGALYGPSSASVTVTAVQAPTNVSVTPTPNATVTEGADSVPFVVTATATSPGITMPVPVPGAPVYLSINGGTAALVGTTLSDGTFPDTISGITASGNYTFSIGSTTLSQAGTATAVQVTAQAATTAITVAASPPKVFGTQSVTFTGNLATTATNPATISGVPVSVSIGGATPVSAGTTDSNGNFTYIDPTATATDYNFSVAGTSLYTAATKDVTLSINEATTSIAVTPSATSVTEGAQNVTFNGTVTGVLALNGNTIPLPSVPVSIGVHGQPAIKTVTTDSNGNFTTTITGIAKTTAFDLTIAAGSNYTMASTQVQIVAQPTATRIVETSTTPPHLKYGQKVTIRGIAQYAGATAWAPLPSSSVLVKVGAYKPTLVKTGTDGSFSVALATLRGPNWSASVVAGSLIESSSTGGILTIQVPLRVNSFAAKLTVGDTVAAAGCLQVTVPYSRGPQSKIHIDYAASARGPWKDLGTLPLRNGAHATPGCRAVSEASFDGSLPAKLANAYYRADFPANNGFDAALSQVIHSARTQTKITNFAIKPLEVNTGGVVTITGRLWHLGKSWQPYANRPIVILYHQAGSNFWGRIKGAFTTSKNGYFTAKAAGGPGKFVAIMYAEYQGSSTDLATRSNGIDVSINHGKLGEPAIPASLAPAMLRPVMPGVALLGAEVIAVKDDVQRMLIRHVRRSARR